MTYPLHVILRYELEQDMLAGRLEVRDLPEAWDAKMRDYLGLSTLDNPKDGPMQDVHWPAGAFGYFPSYTLGAMMAAQQFAAIKRLHPDVNDVHCRRRLHSGERLAARQYLVSRLDEINAADHAGRHRRAAQCGAFHRAFEGALWEELRLSLTPPPAAPRPSPRQTAAWPAAHRRRLF